MEKKLEFKSLQEISYAVILSAHAFNNFKRKFNKEINSIFNFFKRINYQTHYNDSEGFLRMREDLQTYILHFSFEETANNKLLYEALNLHLNDIKFLNFVISKKILFLMNKSKSVKNLKVKADWSEFNSILSEEKAAAEKCNKSGEIFSSLYNSKL